MKEFQAQSVMGMNEIHKGQRDASQDKEKWFRWVMDKKKELQVKNFPYNP
jgi:hypothetical protein